MSSGGIVIAPAAIVVAAGAVVVLTAAAAAVLAVRAANAAAEGAARALGDYGEKLEAVASGQARTEVAAMVWETVAGDVVELNARIRMLSERAARAGVLVVVPQPLSLTGRDVADAAAWLPRAAQLLRGAQADMDAAVAENEGRLLAARLPRAVPASRDTHAALQRLQTTLRERHVPRVVTTRDTRVRDSARADALLRTLDEDVNERERLDVLEAAALVELSDAVESGVYLRTLQKAVASANGAARRRRLAAQWLAALEEPTVAGVEPPDPFAGTAAKLRAVVAGDADLTPQLRSEGAEAAAWSEDIAQREFVRTLMHSCLAGQGYTVDVEFDLQHSAALRLTRADWHGEHTADVWVDRNRVVHGQVVREYKAAGDGAALRDRSRCADFHSHLDALGRTLGADVIIDDGCVPPIRDEKQAPHDERYRDPAQGGLRARRIT